jgi:Putative Ig domain
MRQLLLIAIVALFCLPVRAQTYNANTTVAPVAYPSPIPCPSSAGCSGGGALTGAGYCFNPTDFATEICRVTDFNTIAPENDFETNCGGSAEANIMDESDTRFSLCGTGGVVLVFTFNGSTNPPTWTQYTSPAVYDGEYFAPSCGATGGDAVGGDLFWSFMRPQIAYGLTFNAANDPVICQYDFSNPTVGATMANGNVSQLVDLASCVPALAGGDGGNAYEGDVSVSGDDQTFAAMVGTTSSQGSSGVVYAIVWNRTNGCRVWETDTGTVTGAYGGAPIGTIGTADTFILHNVRISKGGQYVKVDADSCLNTACTDDNVQLYFWQINSLHVTEQTLNDPTGCGHDATGYNASVNKCNTSSEANGLFIRQIASPATSTSLPATYPPGSSDNSAHLSWNNDNATDTSPFFASFALETDSFKPVNAWDNEILGVATDGSGTVYRFAHTYDTNQSSEFDAANAIGDVSADGKYYFWTTDWDGMLGAYGGGSNSCSISSSCREDVFVALLNPGSVTPSGIQITTTGLPNGQVGVAYSQTLAAIGGTMPYSWSSTTLPGGLSLSAAGAITGTPTTAGSMSVMFTATDSSSPAETANVTISMTIAAAEPPLTPVSIRTTTLPNGQVELAYPSTTLAATGGTTPYTWTAAGLAPGLNLSSGGVISGTPTSSGTFTESFTVTDSSSPKQTATASFTITIAPTAVSAVTITTTGLPNGRVDRSYSSKLHARGGTKPYIWSATGLAPGLTLSSSGDISGTPTTAGTFTEVITATDSASPANTSNASFTVTISPERHDGE